MKDVLRQAASIFLLALAAVSVPLLGFVAHNLQVIVTEEVVRILGWMFALSFAIALVSLAVGLGRRALTLRLGLALSATVMLLLMHSSLELDDSLYWTLVAAAVLFGLAAGVPAVVRAATVGALVAAAFPMWQIISEGRLDLAFANTDPSAPEAAAAADLPNVYFFVTDGHAGAVSLSELYGIDTADFTNELRSLGYVVPPAARANYPMTFMAVSAMLQMEYMAREGDEPFTDRGIFHGVFSDMNPTLAGFDALGYRIVKQSSGYWGATRCQPVDTECMEPRNRWWFTPLEYNLLKMTSLKLARFEELSPTISTISDAASEIPRLVAGGRPFFYFGHTLPPHRPRVYDENCALLSDWRSPPPISEDEYALQVRCVDQDVISFAEIVAAEDPGAIVIFTADHGHDKFVDWDVALDAWSEDALLDRFNIFMAVKAPEQCQRHVSDDFSPVNLMRLTLACVAGTEPDLLENSSYVSVYEANPDYGHVKRVDLPF